jgi:hypothetical protein
LRDAPAPARYSLVVLGTCLVTPYLHDYDLVFGAFVAAWLMGMVADAPEWRRPAFIASALVLLLPFVASMLAKVSGFSFGPAFIGLAFAIALCMAFMRRQMQFDTPAERGALTRVA